MLPAGPLTADDLDVVGTTRQDDPRATATALAAAVDEGRFADPDDVGYALGLAAELAADGGDLETAEGLAGRAADAERHLGVEHYGHHEAHRAEVLFRLDRTDEAMALLTALRPALATDQLAADYVGHALIEGDRAEVAERWLTSALGEVRARVGPDGLGGAEDLDEQQSRDVELLYRLLQARHDVREDLGLPHDSHDRTADELRELHEEDLAEAARQPVTVRYWPAGSFEPLLERWPVLAGLYGESWDEHRTRVELTLVDAQEAGSARLGVRAGSVEELAALVAEHEEVDDDLLVGIALDYGETAADEDPETPWPPERNAACWCGSGRKYKKCCRPRLAAAYGDLA